MFPANESHSHVMRTMELLLLGATPTSEVMQVLQGI